MANEKRLIDANAFKVFLEEIRRDYLEEDTFSSNFAAKLIETVQDNYLELAPTVDAVEVKHGRWERAEEFEFISGEYVTTGYHCNKCGCYYIKKSNYCPNCGADMR